MYGTNGSRNNAGGTAFIKIPQRKLFASARTIHSVCVCMYAAGQKWPQCALSGCVCGTPAERQNKYWLATGRVGRTQPQWICAMFPVAGRLIQETKLNNVLCTCFIDSFLLPSF